MSAAESWLEETRSVWLYAQLAKIEPERRVAELFAALGAEASKQALTWAEHAARAGAASNPCWRR